MLESYFFSYVGVDFPRSFEHGNDQHYSRLQEISKRTVMEFISPLYLLTKGILEREILIKGNCKDLINI